VSTNAGIRGFYSGSLVMRWDQRLLERREKLYGQSRSAKGIPYGAQRRNLRLAWDSRSIRPFCRLLSSYFHAVQQQQHLPSRCVSPRLAASFHACVEHASRRRSICPCIEQASQPRSTCGECGTQRRKRVEIVAPEISS